MDVLKKVPVREQEAQVRAKNFDEVCLGYNMDEAKCEAERCINCKNAQCMKGCPVSINIPEFIEQVKLGNIEEAYKIISDHQHFRQFVDVYVLRRANVRVNVSEDLRVNLFQLVSWNVLLLTGQEKMESNRHRQKKSWARK